MLPRPRSVLLPLAGATSLFAVTALEASPRTAGPNRTITCRCLSDSDGSSDLCYGYNLTLGVKNLEVTEGETSGSGAISARPSGKSVIYSALVTTETGGRFSVYAVRSPTGRTKIYTEAMSRRNLSFVALCR